MTNISPGHSNPFYIRLTWSRSGVSHCSQIHKSLLKEQVKYHIITQRHQKSLPEVLSAPNLVSGCTPPGRHLEVQMEHVNP